MGFLSRFEGKMEDTVEGAAGKLSRTPISPVQIAKQCEKRMMREKMVGAGKQYAPTLYTVLVNPNDDAALFNFYPTLAGEVETYLSGKANEQGLYMDGHPLVRFVVDDGLRSGRFDVIAEVVASAIVAQLRQEEMERYGIAQPQSVPGARGNQQYRQAAPIAAPQAQVVPPVAAPVAAPPASNAGIDPYAPRDYNEFDNNCDGAYDNNYGGAYDNGGYDAYAAPIAQAPSAMQGIVPARLIDLTHNRAYALDKPSMIAGRADECNIVIPDINASRNHAEFAYVGDGVWEVRDLGSKNGTLVNGRIIQHPATLFEGDRLVMGLTEYQFTMVL